MTTRKVFLVTAIVPLAFFFFVLDLSNTQFHISLHPP